LRGPKLVKPAGDGHTEWFAEEIRDEVLAFLAANAKYFKLSEARPIPPRPATLPKPAPPPKPSVITPEPAEPTEWPVLIHPPDALEIVQRMFTEHCIGKVKDSVPLKANLSDTHRDAFVFRDEPAITESLTSLGVRLLGPRRMSDIFYSSLRIMFSGRTTVWFVLRGGPSSEEHD
jgi:hypothetical protein